jgi:hypothetical protein
MPPCQTCRLVGTALLSGESIDELDLGSYSEMKRRTERATCQQIASSRFIPSDIDGSTELKLLRKQQPSSEYQITDESYSDFMIDIIPLASNGAHSSVGIFIDTERIDMGRLKSWLRYCEDNHESTCSASTENITILPYTKLLLIDVHQGCLVERAGSVRYFALSYVWGQMSDTAETRLSNISELSIPGAITADSTNLNLPETIRDAIRLVKILEGRYLWIDRLCIVQDDLATKAQAIQEMGAIYAYSHCTIVAADGCNANHGLRGIGSGSKPRYCQQEVLQFPGCPVLVQQELDSEKRAKWSKRGWTYQEQLFSRRILVFSGDVVFWRCQRSEYREDLTAEPDGAIRPEVRDGNQMLLRSINFPDLSQFGSLAGFYNRRDLSFESDTRDAFAGIETVLSQAFPGGICNGLPEFFFDKALLWQPLSPMQERNTSLSSNLPLSDRNYLPSWSWLGWKGSLDPLSWKAGFDFPESLEHLAWDEQSSEMVYPLVQWTKLEARPGQYPNVSGSQQDIQNEYHTWRQAALSSKPGQVYDEALVHGWCRHDTKSSQSWYTNPKTNGVRFRYPIPLPKPNQINPAMSNSWFPALRLRSTRAFFVLGDHTPSLDMRRTLCTMLRDKRGRWGGILRLNISHTDVVREGTECELVAISRGTARNDHDESHFLEEWGLEERYRGSALYEFYNVYWVQHQHDGCITRRALGRVEKSIWDDADLEEVDFILR